MKIDEDVFQKIINDIQNMTREEFERDILCLNGTMSESLMDKVINYVCEIEYIHEEDMRYFPENYSITVDEFMDVFNFLEQYLEEGGQKVDVSVHFYSDLAKFKYKDKIFYWRLMTGQGACCQLFLDPAKVLENPPQNIPTNEININDFKKMKFYKK